MPTAWRTLFVALTLLLSACGQQTHRMQQPEDPQGRFREQITVARRLLAQKEDWADRVEWEVEECWDGWKITAWRIERPDRKGIERYLPWGYSVIKLDRRLVPVHYRRKG